MNIIENELLKIKINKKKKNAKLQFESDID